MSNTKKRNNIYTRLATVLFAITGLLMVTNVWADGSKDWYPNGATGYRAFIRSSTTVTTNYPFPNQGTHYVYAKVGETITLASSAQSGAIGTNAKIKLYAPNGSAVTLSGSVNNGQILNRTAEKAGPLRPGETANNNKYIPIYHLVTVEGVYRVEFLALGSSNEPNTTVNANDDWTQASTDLGIAAWDVSVVNTAKTGFIAGRVYTNVLNLSNGSSNPQSNGFYGNVFVRTKDGYTYRVNNNGNNGMYFTFFVNNNGFVDATTQLPIYKSINTTSNLGNQVHNPNNADVGTHITHKLFYTLPATDLPTTAPIAVTSNAGTNWGAGSTWLKTAPIVPTVTTPELIGLDGTNVQVSNKGGHIKFIADVQGNYTIEIQSKESPASLLTRVMTGQASAGLNSVLWDGKDGAGKSLPAGTAPVKVTVQLQGAEVHFPFFDMEYNIKGTIIELLKHEALPTQTVQSDIVYWNDTDVPNGTSGTNIPRGNRSDPKNNSHLPPASSVGIKSTINGHIWGQGATGTSGQFGDNKSIDTWTFITGEKKESETDITVKVADLQVTSITSNKTTLVIGDEITYTVKVKNNHDEPLGSTSDVVGAPFSFILPPGFEHFGTPAFIGGGCGTENVSIAYDAINKKYTSTLNLPSGCEITYTFNVKVTDQSDPANTKAIATIMRPKDVTDPDATNTSNPSKPLAPAGVIDLDNYYYPPTDPFFEVRYNGKEGVSNNIKDLPVGLERRSDLAIVKTANTTEAKIGDVVTFTLTVANNGPHAAIGVVVTDTVPAGYTVGVINNSGVASGNVITWTIGNLADEGSVVLSFKATVKNSGAYLNTAWVKGDVVDPDLTNNKSSINPVLSTNYWIGGVVGKENDWAEKENWTASRVPEDKEDIEFATEANNPTVVGKPSSGPAKEDLHLDTDRNIGDLINKSDKNLIVTLENELVIHGKVHDDNTGGIVVQADPNKPAGTLLFANPGNNGNVDATVQFYSKAYECADCGFYRKSWQYFGVPIRSGEFPYQTPKVETINQWVESFNGNKWRPAPYAPDTELKAFKGYEMTSSATALPSHIYDFKGKLVVGDATVALTKTTGVNYAGSNLVGNSYTAAIPISEAAIKLPAGFNKTVYLFNTGTRDQWRKLNGSTVTGYKTGQYLTVPLNLGGQSDFPDRIPSTHAFMILAEEGSAASLSGNVVIDYSQLVKNAKVKLGDGSGTEIVTRTVAQGPEATTTESIASLIVDVIGEECADRLWIFSKQSSTHGFDNGWDGRKMLEENIAQFFVAASDSSQLQVATVPAINKVVLGFIPEMDGKYTLDFAPSAHLKGMDIYLHDTKTGTTHRVSKEQSYSFDAKRGDAVNRFNLSYAANNSVLSEDEVLIDVITTKEGEISIVNGSSNTCTALVSDGSGKLLQRIEVKGKSESVIKDIAKGVYMIRLQNAGLNDVRRVVVK